MAWFLASANQPLDAIFFASLFALTFLSDLLVVSTYSYSYSVSIFSIMLSYGVVGSSGVLQEG